MTKSGQKPEGNLPLKGQLQWWYLQICDFPCWGTLLHLCVLRQQKSATLQTSGARGQTERLTEKPASFQFLEGRESQKVNTKTYVQKSD